MAIRFASVAKTYFIVVGVLTTIILAVILAGSVWFAMTLLVPAPTERRPTSAGTSESVYDHPLLSPEQERAAASFGIDTRTLPTEITIKQQQCAVAALGADRAQQILNGSSPTLLDIARAKHCFGY